MNITTDPFNTERFRFDWDELPVVSDDMEGTGGRVRVEIDDFQVTEIPSYLPSGNGDYIYLYVEKRDLTSYDIVDALKRHGVSERDVGMAGRKDKRAVTRQWFSVHREHEDKIHAVEDLEGARIIQMSRHKNKLRLGHLKGNEFLIRVRGSHESWEERLGVICERIYEWGLPNYFGPQRFGHFNTNAIDGMRLVNGLNVQGGRRMHKFFLSALQSHVFNHILRMRFSHGHYRAILSGDMAQKHDTGGMFVVEDTHTDSRRAKGLDISAVIPMFGKKIKKSTGNAGVIEQSILDEYGLTWECFRMAHGARRTSRIKVDYITSKSEDDGYSVRFGLPKGSFATVLLREITKTEHGSN